MCGMLYPIKNYKSPLPTLICIWLFNMNVIPSLTYSGAASSLHLNKTQWKGLEVIQTIKLRTISITPVLCQKRILFRQSHVLRVQYNIKTSLKRYFTLIQSPNFDIFKTWAKPWYMSSKTFLYKISWTI